MDKVDKSTEAFLLGMAMAALDAVREHLIQGEHKEALSVANNANRTLSDKIDQHFYNKEMPREHAINPCV